MLFKSLKSYRNRLKEIDQLLAAHEALVRFRKAESALGTRASKDLKSALRALQYFVTDPGRGRPREVHALNNAAIALLSGHLQGFISDIFREVATWILKNSVKDMESVLTAAPTRGNPNAANISKLFATIGFPEILEGISRQAVSNESFKRHLREFNELRNSIVHGNSERVRKQTVRKYLNLWRSFAVRFEKRLRVEVRAIVGKRPIH